MIRPIKMTLSDEQALELKPLCDKLIKEARHRQPGAVLGQLIFQNDGKVRLEAHFVAAKQTEAIKQILVDMYRKGEAM